MKHTQAELQETLNKMKNLIDKAQCLAEPILTRWDGDEIQAALNKANMVVILKKDSPVMVPSSTHHSSNGRT